MKKLLTLFLILFSISTFISAKENPTIIGKKGVKFMPAKDNTKSAKPIKIKIPPKIFIN